MCWPHVFLGNVEPEMVFVDSFMVIIQEQQQQLWEGLFIFVFTIIKGCQRKVKISAILQKIKSSTFCDIWWIASQSLLLLGSGCVKEEETWCPC